MRHFLGPQAYEITKADSERPKETSQMVPRTSHKAFFRHLGTLKGPKKHFNASFEAFQL